MSSTVAIFVSGMAGALSREVFRWRTLYVAGRMAKYLHPLYLGIAAVIIVLGGTVSLIFAPLLPIPNSQLPAAFVIGAGLELIVQQAAKLKMPKVPMGPESNEAAQASIEDFLRL